MWIGWHNQVTRHQQRMEEVTRSFVVLYVIKSGFVCTVINDNDNNRELNPNRIVKNKKNNREGERRKKNISPDLWDNKIHLNHFLWFEKESRNGTMYRKRNPDTSTYYLLRTAHKRVPENHHPGRTYQSDNWDFLCYETTMHVLYVVSRVIIGFDG